MTQTKTVVHIRTPADVHNAVFAIRSLARNSGMNDGASASIATAISELVTNVLKYAGSGRMTYWAKRRAERPGIEATVQDFGPGIENIEKAMTDNVSTSGTLGLGLPGAKRLVDEFEIDSTPGKGTTVRVLKWG